MFLIMPEHLETPVRREKCKERKLVGSRTERSRLGISGVLLMTLCWSEIYRLLLCRPGLPGAQNKVLLQLPGPLAPTLVF